MTTPPTHFADCPVVELRRYTLRPGAFDRLLDIFQTSLLDGLEHSGMRVGGQFRDTRRPDRFVWMRGFASMDQRRAALTDFYYGPVWRAHREAANDTMLDSDDVFLLRATDPPHRASPADAGSTAAGPTTSAVRAIAEVIAYPADPGTDAWLAGEFHAGLEARLGTAVAAWRTEPAANTFPALPVRTEHAFVWLAVFDDADSLDTATQRLADDVAWVAASAARLAGAGASVERMELQPTARSRHPLPTVA